MDPPEKPSAPVAHKTAKIWWALGIVVALAALAVIVWPLLQDPPTITSGLVIVQDSAQGLAARMDVTKSASVRCEWKAPRNTSCLPRAAEQANKENRCSIDVERDCLSREDANVEVRAWAEERCLWRRLRSEAKNATWPPHR